MSQHTTVTPQMMLWGCRFQGLKYTYASWMLFCPVFQVFPVDWGTTSANQGNTHSMATGPGRFLHSLVINIVCKYLLAAVPQNFPIYSCIFWTYCILKCCYKMLVPFRWWILNRRKHLYGTKPHKSSRCCLSLNISQNGPSFSLISCLWWVSILEVWTCTLESLWQSMPN